MTKEQAIAEMKKGNKVTHRFFSPNEWIKITNGLFEFEDGVKCAFFEFWKYRMDGSWEDGWELFISTGDSIDTVMLKSFIKNNKTKNYTFHIMSSLHFYRVFDCETKERDIAVYPSFAIFLKKFFTDHFVVSEQKPNTHFLDVVIHYKNDGQIYYTKQSTNIIFIICESALIKKFDVVPERLFFYKHTNYKVV